MTDAREPATPPATEPGTTDGPPVITCSGGLTIRKPAAGTSPAAESGTDDE